MSRENRNLKVVVVGGGFTGLAAAYELACRGIAVTVLERDYEIGGLAGGFTIGEQRLERFYHHFFTNNEDAFGLIKELGNADRLIYAPTTTGVYFNGKFFDLSTPVDLLRFEPLPFWDRIRLGLSVFRAQRIKDFKRLEALTAEQWLLRQCGRKAYRVVWEPLLRGKFGSYASQISAAWFWKKIAMRSSSRDRGGKETLVYYRGGFTAFAESIVREIKCSGGGVQNTTCVEGLVVEDGRIKGVRAHDGMIEADVVVATPALPIIADLVGPYVSQQYIDELSRIKYLANVCLLMELDHSLSDIYWLNVNDPDFPFVGLIEHTNFQPPATCANRHIVYLSKYLLETDEMYRMDEHQLLELSLPYITRMFPKFEESWVRRCHVHRARYAQPVVECRHGDRIPSYTTPIKNFYIATMAQIYPEDRGVSDAIRQGRHVGRMVAEAGIS